MALKGYQVIIFEWSCVVLALSMIILRLYIRLWCRRVWSWSDVFVFLGWIFFVGQVSADTYLETLGYYNIKSYGTKIDISVKAALPPDSAVKVFKVQYVESGAYYFTMYCVKAAILDFYFELIPRGYRKTWFMLKFTVGTTILGFVLSTAFRFCWCWPISRNWSLDPKEFCTAGNGAVAGGITFIFHVGTDLMVYCLPFPIIKSLKMKTRQKIAVSFIFGMGLLCIAFAVATVLVYVVGSSTATGNIFTGLEQSWAIIVVCLPAFKAFLSGNVKQALKRWKPGSNNASNVVGSRASKKKPPKLTKSTYTSTIDMDGTIQMGGLDEELGMSRSGGDANTADDPVGLTSVRGEEDVEMNRLVIPNRLPVEAPARSSSLQEPGVEVRRPSYALLPPKPLRLVPWTENNANGQSPPTTAQSGMSSGRLTPAQMLTPTLTPGARVIIPE